MNTFLYIYTGAMPRRKELEGTTVCKKLKQPLPLFEEFARRLLPTEDIPTSTRSLHERYVEMVKAMVGCVEGKEVGRKEIEIASSFVRFSKRLSTYASEHGFVAVNSRCRGYNVSVPRLSRSGCVRAEPSVQPTRRVTRLPATATQASVAVDPGDTSALFNVLLCDPVKGRGCFAARNLDANVRLCEYRGQKISSTEADERERHYEAEGKKPVMVWVNQGGRGRTDIEGSAVDGYMNEFGQPFGDAENKAILFNHDRVDPNCDLRKKLVSGKLYLYTKRKVPEGFELKWDYNHSEREQDLLELGDWYVA